MMKTIINLQGDNIDDFIEEASLENIQFSNYISSRQLQFCVWAKQEEKEMNFLDWLADKFENEESQIMFISNPCNCLGNLTDGELEFYNIYIGDEIQYEDSIKFDKCIIKRFDKEKEYVAEIKQTISILQKLYKPKKSIN